MVEDVVNLPTQLEVAFLVDPDVLEEREIVVEDAGHANGISRQVSYLTCCPRFRYA